MHISGTIEAYGPHANEANAAQAQATIRQFWNQGFPDGYSVTCDVTVVYRASPSGNVVTIEMDKITGPSNVSRFTGNMELNMNEDDALTWTVAHEFGHQIGLRDRYSEGIMSKIRGKFGGRRTSTVEGGYEQNLMGVVGGATESRTVQDLGAENAPGYFTSDDQIRLWVARHTRAERGALSTATKIHMINLLLEGWIADEDVATIESICLAVTDASESTAIKRALEARLLDMTSIGQRTYVRGIITRMP